MGEPNGRGKLLGKGKEGIEVREGERLSDWFEVGEVFGHLEGKDDERVLVVQRGEFSSISMMKATWLVSSTELMPTLYGSSVTRTLL